MGIRVSKRSFESLINLLTTMKVAAILAATASANPTQFIMDNWWKEAVNVFNFASGNWDQFSSTVDTIPSEYWDPLWAFCNGDGDSEVTSAELTACGAKAAAWADDWIRRLIARLSDTIK